MDRDDHAVAFVDLVQSQRIDGVGIDLSDADSNHLFGIFRSDFGIHFRIFLTAVSDQDKVSSGHAFDHIVDHAKFVLAPDDQPLFDQFIPESKPLQVHATYGEVSGAEKVFEGVVDLPWAAADVVEHCSSRGPLLIDFGHAFDRDKGFCESSPEHFSAAAHVGVFDGIVDVCDDADTLFCCKKDCA